MNPVGFGPALVDYDDTYVIAVNWRPEGKDFQGNIAACSRLWRYASDVPPSRRDVQDTAGAPVPEENVEVRASGVPTVIPAQREGITPALPELDGVYFGAGIGEANYAIAIVV